MREGRTTRGMPRVAVFSDSHTSVDSASRTPRAFSRAAWRAPATEEGFARSVTRRSSTRCTVRSSAGTSVTPKIPYTPAQESTGSREASSVIDWSDTPRMRAVWSARST